ncbi:hypothetical protein Y1Q_0015012 [Alligator mississippiensis]|uniref:Uncharacterized protein n=1 Tax=Alligator mississippiensis TaxID=8496 RepID=A0A151N8Y9_ALLMI|nr:hypothetical protein Y1Q_0015012 [Alligator mississippiensis]
MVMAYASSVLLLQHFRNNEDLLSIHSWFTIAPAQVCDVRDPRLLQHPPWVLLRVAFEPVNTGQVPNRCRHTFTKHAQTGTGSPPRSATMLSISRSTRQSRAAVQNGLDLGNWKTAN